MEIAKAHDIYKEIEIQMRIISLKSSRCASIMTKNQPFLDAEFLRKDGIVKNE